MRTLSCAATAAWSDGHRPPGVLLSWVAPKSAILCTTTLPRVKIKSIRKTFYFSWRTHYHAAIWIIVLAAQEINILTVTRISPLP